MHSIYTTTIPSFPLPFQNMHSRQTLVRKQKNPRCYDCLAGNLFAGLIPPISVHDTSSTQKSLKCDCSLQSLHEYLTSDIPPFKIALSLQSQSQFAHILTLRKVHGREFRRERCWTMEIEVSGCEDKEDYAGRRRCWKSGAGDTGCSVYVPH
jgi:hypothetical protein